MGIEPLFLNCAVEKLQEFMGRIEVCLGKLNEKQIWTRHAENENAIGNLVLHLNGNAGQWIVASLGNNPDHRDRDAEFDARGGFSAAQLAARLRDTVERAAAIIAALTNEQLTRTYVIQNYKVSGVEAVFHVVEHFSMHTGQIIFITKMLTGADLGFYRHLHAENQGSRRRGGV
jgi:uncharacterized damage-inducible protein DinB